MAIYEEKLEKIQMWKERRKVKKLIQALEDKDPIVRLGAADALGDIGETCAVEPLIKALGDEDLNVMLCATAALGKMGKPAIEPLIDAFEKEESVRNLVTLALTKILTKIGDAKSVNVAPFIKALGDEDPDVRKKAVDALRSIR